MRCTSRLRDERGMTLIELMISAVICATGIMATIAVMDTSRKVSVKAEHRDAMAHHAEREAERLMELPWDSFRHASTPITAASPAGNPSTWISGGGFAYDRKSPTTYEPLSVGTGGEVPTTYTTFDDGQARLKGRLYRYVTTVEPNARRLTVVATGDGIDPPAAVIVSSIKTKPLL